jgi:hypothetical protein
MDKLSLDVRCILLGLLSGYEVARMARVSQTFYITVAKFFKRTKTLILTGPQYIDATKLSHWPLLSHFCTIEINNLLFCQNVHFNFSEHVLYLYQESGEYACKQILYTDPEDELEHYYEKKEENTIDDYNFLEYMIAEAEDMELEE